MYADDLAILSLSVDDLQAQLNKLFEYCQIWGLEVNTAKTKVMVLSKSGFKKTTNELKLGNQVLQWTSAYKYLGLELHSNGNYVKTAENLCSRGWKAIFKINSSLRNISVKTSTRLHLFDTLVKPIICYGSEVWGSMVNGQSAKVHVGKFWNKAEKIPCEKLHNKFLKICLGVHSKASNAAVRGEMGRFPLVVTIIKAMLNFWLHMVDIAEMNTLINAAMKEALLMEDVPGTWFYSCKQIYSLFGITWTGQAPCRQTFTSLINNIEKSYIAHWRNSLNSKMEARAN